MSNDFCESRYRRHHEGKPGPLHQLQTLGGPQEKDPLLAGSKEGAELVIGVEEGGVWEVPVLFTVLGLHSPATDRLAQPSGASLQRLLVGQVGL